MCYSIRLKIFDINSLIERRKRDDFIEMYKIAKGIDKINRKESRILYAGNPSAGRIHAFRFQKEYTPSCAIRRKIFLNRINSE